MDILSFLNGNFVFPLLALVLLVVYFVNRIKNNRKYKR
ncbi:hypothetical protein C21_00225 [Arenibacter sp. NBRC 103722]|nr:hypothetical protein C21_00225 [Arenibacter sp. NBRC 103722]